MLELEKQVDKARTDRERRWNRLETQVRGDLARLLRRAEKAVEPKPRKKKVAKKSVTKKTAKEQAA